MIQVPFHPSHQSLAAFAAGDAFARRSRVARHLEHCSNCRQFIGFTQRFARAVAAIPAPAPGEELLARALTARAAGARVIVPAPLEPARTTVLGRAMRAVAVVLAAAVVVAWWSARGVRDDFVSANQLFLAGLVPRSAEAGQLDYAGRVMPHQLRPLTVTYQRRFIDRASGRVTDAGKFDLRVAAAESEAWQLTSAWREIAGQNDMQGARTWAESVTVAVPGLIPASRRVHVKPYRRWAGISINQGFRNDSVVGHMALDEDPTRRPIARDLRRNRGRLIAGDAVAPVYFMGVPLAPGVAFVVSAMGWAVVPNDITVSMRMTVDGSDRIDTPAGTFDCWRFAIGVGRETHYHWVRKSDGLGVLTRRRLADGRTRELILFREDSTP